MRKQLLFLLLLGTISLTAQQKTPKIGLVLSGGGAKGGAHIGVLKVIDSLGIKIDYIAGTSAGAIVGGLYASGYSAIQIDSLFRVIDFDKVISDEIPRVSKSFYEKEKASRYVLTLPFQNGNVGIPQAMSKGQNFFNLLSDLTRHVHHITDFNKLPIPFACIATDLETGKGVLLNKGFLPEAIRASSSFPSLLDPVLIDGKLLSDGGIVSNYPVKTLKEMGADIIIGVDIQDNLLKKEQLLGATNILMQIVAFGMYADMQKNIEMTDIYIKPDSISKYAVTDFDKYKPIYELGHKSALKQIESLKLLVNSTVQKNNTKDIIKKISDSIKVKKIFFTGSKHYTDEYLYGKLGIKTPDTVSTQEFKAGINKLSATKNFNSIYYRFVNDDKIMIHLKENPIKKFIKLGAHYDKLAKIGVLINYTVKNPLGKNDFMAIDAIVGNNMRYEFNYFIDNGFHWSYGFRSKLTPINTSVPFQSVTGISTSSLLIDLHSTTISNQLYLQTSFEQKYNIKIGAEHEYINSYSYDLSSSNDKFYLDKNSYFNVFSVLKLDTYDADFNPKKGVFLEGRFKWRLLSTAPSSLFASYSQAQLKFGYAKSLGDFSFNLVSQAGVTIGSSSVLQSYHLGGDYDNLNSTFVPLYGYDFAALTDVSYVHSSLDMFYEFKKNNYFTLGVQAARATDDLINGGDLFDNTKYGFALGLSAKTFVGPIGIKYTRSPQNNTGYWYFNLGYSF